MKFDILTIFPHIFDSYFNEGIIKRARGFKNLVTINTYDLRQFTSNKHQKVDDTISGGGAGMLLQVEPIYKTLEHIIQQNPSTSKHVVLFKAGGNAFNQQKAQYYSQHYEHIIMICGRYEGIDYRVEQYLSHESISIGNYVLTGGEIPAMIIVDAVSRLIPGVLGNQESANEESFSLNPTFKEYPHFSKPAVFKPDNPGLINPDAPLTWETPEVLLSGDHQKIQAWKDKNSS